MSAALLPIAAQAQTGIPAPAGAPPVVKDILQHATLTNHVIRHGDGKALTVRMIHHRQDGKTFVTSTTDDDGAGELTFVTEVRCATGQFRVAALIGNSWTHYPYGAGWKANDPASYVGQANLYGCAH